MTKVAVKTIGLATSIAMALAACGDSSQSGGGGAGQGGNGTTDGGGGAGHGGTTSDGGTSAGGGGASASDWEVYCDARAASCASLDVDACKAQEQCATDFLKDAITDDLLACLATECNEDTCIAATAAEPLTTQGQSFFDACQDWNATCPDTASDDTCSGAYFLADETLAELEDCVTAATCEQAKTCVDGVTATFDACSDWL